MRTEILFVEDSLANRVFDKCDSYVNPELYTRNSLNLRQD